MSHDDLVIEHQNAFNTIINQLSFVDIKITKEETYLSLLFSLLDCWDNLVMVFGSHNTTQNINDVVAALFLKWTRLKNMEGSNPEELLVRG